MKDTPLSSSRQQHDSKKEGEDREAEDRAAPDGVIIYKAILSEGKSELDRASSALFWSGLAAGLSMGFSLIAESALRGALPDAPWRPLVSKLGYSIGFLIVILGRQQLFTENTLTPILPLLQKPESKTFFNVLRLWGLVLLANMLGAFAVAWVLARTPALTAETHQAMTDIGREAMSHGFATHFLRAIFAGWLIALMVWLLPYAESARVLVIILLTYVIGLGHFSHVIAGSVVTFAYAAAGHASWPHVFGGFFVPALLGNVLGGLTLVTALNHAQVVAGTSDQDL